MCGIGSLKPAGIDSQSLNTRESLEGKVEVEEKAAFRIFLPLKRTKEYNKLCVSYKRIFFVKNLSR